jgi:hypothetical protein
MGLNTPVKIQLVVWLSMVHMYRSRAHCCTWMSSHVGTSDGRTAATTSAAPNMIAGSSHLGRAPGATKVGVTAVVVATVRRPRCR